MYNNIHYSMCLPNYKYIPIIEEDKLTKMKLIQKGYNIYEFISSTGQNDKLRLKINKKYVENIKIIFAFSFTDRMRVFIDEMEFILNVIYLENGPHKHLVKKKKKLMLVNKLSLNVTNATTLQSKTCELHFHKTIPKGPKNILCNYYNHTYYDNKPVGIILKYLKLRPDIEEMLGKKLINDGNCNIEYDFIFDEK